MRPQIRAVAAAAGVVTALACGAPAWAHTGVVISPARAGATDALMTVNAEAENDSAGVTSVQVFLPEGITAADITLADAPNGWKLRSDTPDSYTVSGPAVAVGTDAEHQVRIRQLPIAAQVSFKVLQTYSDGRIDRWIEIPSAANPEPANPAPTVKLAGGGTAPSPTTAATPAPAGATSAPPATDAPVTASPSGVSTTSTGSNGPWVLLAGIILAALTAAGVVFYRGRNARV